MANGYEAAKQLMQLTCENCHIKVLVDPSDPVSVESTKEWIMIVPSDGNKLAAHNKECALKTVHKIPTSNLIIS
jgi:hypothetical protein